MRPKKPESEKKKPGRIGKYDYWLTEEGLDCIEAWKRRGLTDKEVAANCGVSPKTFAEWSGRFPELRKRLKANKEIADMLVESALFKKATSGELGAIIFYLCNRCSKRWSNTKFQKKEDETADKTNQLLSEIVEFTKKHQIDLNESLADFGEDTDETADTPKNNI